MKIRLFALYGIAAAGLALLLSWATYRHGLLLSFDSYYYCELSKQFTTTWPDRFGNHWPFGYPILGALLGRLGIPAYFSLCCVSMVSLVALAMLAARILFADGKPIRTVPLFAVCAAPIIAVQIFGIFSELPFAAAYLALVVSIAMWPSRRSVVSACLLAILCLTLRYVGVLAFVLLGGFVLVSWRTLRTERKLGFVIACVTTAGVFAALLLAINMIRSGHLSGADRSGSPGIGAFWEQLADFGWSAPSAMVAGVLRDRIGPTTTVGRAIGFVITVGMLGLCVSAWRTPRSQFSRALALAAAVYVIGISLLRCFGTFDELWGARTFLPILVPTTFLLFQHIQSRPALSFAIAGVLLLSGCIFAVRGISRQIGGEISPAAKLLKPLLTAKDAVAINDHALTLSAYLSQPVWRQPQGSERFFVFAAKPTDRQGTPGAVDRDFNNAVSEMLSSGQWQPLLMTYPLVVLQRVPSKQ